LFFLETIEDQFHAGRNAQFFEHAEKVIPHELGSTALGFSVAFLGLDFYRAHLPTRSALLFPLLTAAFPLLDAICAIVRRLRNRASPFQGDRAHIYDRAFARGWNARQIALASYAITATLAGIALLGVHRGSRGFWIVSALSVAMLFYATVRLGSLQGNDRGLLAQNVAAPQTHEEYGEPSSTS
jgi:hypothetical protein